MQTKSMQTKSIETAWLWPTEDGGVWGMRLDPEDQMVRTADSVNCSCDEHYLEQTFEDFLRAGGPRYANAPDDVVREALDSVRQLITAPD